MSAYRKAETDLNDAERRRVQAALSQIDKAAATLETILGARPDPSGAELLARVAERMTERGIKGAQVARELGVSKQFVSQLLTGRAPAGPATRVKIEAWLQAPPPGDA